MVEYYEAYDERYKQIHALALQWAGDVASPIVAKTIAAYGVRPDAKLLEIGCGEGRDARPLLEQGFDLLATDVSPEAIAHCRARSPEFSERFAVLDCVTDELDARFDFVYAVAVVHMLLDDAHRVAFYRFIREHLSEEGVALICTMGDGEMEHCGDASAARQKRERWHEPSGRTLMVTDIPCRIVNFCTFEREIERSGLAVLERGMTAIEPEFSQVMYAVVARQAR